MQSDIKLKTPPIPTTNPTTNNIVFDEGGDLGVHKWVPGAMIDDRRVRLTAFIDQAATVIHEVYLPLADGTYSATARAVNGAGDTITASTLFKKDYLLEPGRNVIRISTTTLPTVWEIGARAIPDRVFTATT
jgi:hypothetical protein